MVLPKSPRACLLVLTSPWSALPSQFGQCLPKILLDDVDRLYGHLCPGAGGGPPSRPEPVSLSNKVRIVKDLYGRGASRPDLDIRILLKGVRTGERLEMPSRNVLEEAKVSRVIFGSRDVEERFAQGEEGFFSG